MYTFRLPIIITRRQSLAGDNIFVSEKKYFPFLFHMTIILYFFFAYKPILKLYPISSEKTISPPSSNHAEVKYYKNY